jgi:hypothetical protein
MMRRSNGKKWLMRSLLVAGLAIALLVWLEWLGSAQPLQVMEIPVAAPATVSGSRN